MNGKNSKIIKITDINNNQYCLLNRYVQFYKKNLWQYLNFGGSSKDVQILHLNFFDYFDIEELKILQYSKCIKDDTFQNNKGLLSKQVRIDIGDISLTDEEMESLSNNLNR